MLRPANQIQEYILKKPKGYVDKESNHTEHNLLLKRFDMGENRSALKILKQHLTSALLDEISSYPDPTYTQLTARLTGKYNITPDQITIGTGANEIIERINRAYLSDARDCIIFEPTFYRIKDSALRCTKNIRAIKLDKKTNYSISDKDVSNIRNYNTNSLVWICSPNNPVGSITGLNTIKEIATQNPDKIICVDEAYGDYIVDWDKNYSALNLISEHNNIIVLKTFSKLLGLAGLTIGYAIGNENLINPLNNIRLEFPITTVSEKLSILVLDNWNNFKTMAEDISRKRKYVEEKLDTLENIEHIPSKTSIILVRHKTKKLHSELLNKNILTASMNTCDGLNNEGWVRITLQNNNTDNNTLIKILEEINK